MLELCSNNSLSPVFLYEKESKKKIWECKEYENRSKLEEVSSPIKKGEELEFIWKIAGKEYRVTGIVEKTYNDWKSTNPAQKYLYQIRLTKPLVMTMDPGRRITIKRISMKDIQKLY